MNKKDSAELEKLLTLFVVEYSLSTDSFHIHSVRVMLKNNLANIAKGHSTDYLPVGVFDNRADADKFKVKVGIRLAKAGRSLLNKDGTRNFVRISSIIESVVRSINKIPASSGAEKKYV
ncbi:MAG TPA: hypothetical protein PKY59_17030 [Pyrinomonadaceae bacterium]|nr:hypothetical protein [Pyrinomonadaceae bacterium]